MIDRPTKHQTLMRIAHVVSLRSTCSRRAVGCVLTDDDRELVAMGYNGGPKGGRNECARAEAGRCGCLHAEVNALLKAPRGLTVAYVTTCPCEACATALVNYGIQEVWFRESYRTTEGLAVLEAAGVNIQTKGVQ